jgi:photosystem II stability/assembly factor-like uncharacterized protein
MREDHGPSGRARRAVPLIAAAIAVIVVAGVLYVRSVVPSPTAAPTSPHIPVMSGPYTATYDFLTPSLGWALILDYGTFSTTLSTHFWVFKTNDGARKWQQQYEGAARGGRTYLLFFDSEHGFAFAGVAYRTVDGGAHWETMQVPGSMAFVTFASPILGWAEEYEVGSQHLYATADGGMTWRRLPTDPPVAAVLEPVYEIQSSAFRAGGEGWLGAGYLSSPVVYLTLDGGASWREVAMPSTRTGAIGPGYLTSARIVPGSGVVVLVSDESAQVLGAFFSHDQGGSWRQIAFPIAVSTFDDLSFVDATNWWVLRSGHLWKTSDAGITWRQVSVLGLPDGWRYESARVIDARHAWWSMVSSARSTLSALAITADGGSHWATVNVPQPPPGPPI